MSTEKILLFKRTREPIRDNQCFVLMPFHQKYQEIYEDVLKPTIVELGYSCLRADELSGSRAIIQDIWQNIQISGLIVADMTDKNPNVFYELGLAHAIGKNVILITQSLNDVPFDLQHLRCILYEHNLRGAIKLKQQLRKTIMQDPFIYSRIPIDILTDKFLGGFISKSICFNIDFEGLRGHKSVITETYDIVATHEFMQQFYKKVQTPGRLVSAEADSAEIQIKQLFPGMYLLSIAFPKSLSINDEHRFSIKYEIEDGFPDENEFWFYNVETRIDELSLKFNFPDVAQVRDFRVLRSKDGKESQIDNQARSKVEKDISIFEWYAKELNIPDCYVFRWHWQ